MSISKTADALVFSGVGEDLSLLLVKRAHDPYKDFWAFPGGFIEDGENALEACLRELGEETGIQLDAKEAIPLSERSQRGRDPRGEVHSSPFLFYLREKKDFCAGDDAKEAAWVRLLDVEALAFDHGAILLEALGKFWSFMPSFSESLNNISLPRLFMKKKVFTDDLIFYGGSFNPWHEGHTTCLKLCEGNILVVPDRSPWKENIPAGCQFQRYKNLCKSLPDYEIYPGFMGLEKTNPTVNWLPFTKFKSRSLLMGDDSFMSFERWKDYKTLLKSLKKIYVVPRDHSLTELEAKKQVFEVGVVILPEHDYQKLSSTKLRG